MAIKDQDYRIEKDSPNATAEQVGMTAAQTAGASTFIADTQELLAKQKKHRIMIPSTERDKNAVQVGINGYVYNIPRDKEVEVPEAVLEVLKNASLTVFTQKKREEGEGNELVETGVRRFAYQSMG